MILLYTLINNQEWVTSVWPVRSIWLLGSRWTGSKARSMCCVERAQVCNNLRLVCIFPWYANTRAYTVPASLDTDKRCSFSPNSRWRESGRTAFTYRYSLTRGSKPALVLLRRFEYETMQICHKATLPPYWRALTVTEAWTPGAGNQPWWHSGVSQARGRGGTALYCLSVSSLLSVPATRKVCHGNGSAQTIHVLPYRDISNIKQICYLIQSQDADIAPISPSTDLIKTGIWQDSH